MPKDLSSKLSSLRLQYLSSNALEQFKNAELENLKDALAGYDILIDNFDYLWSSSLKINHLNSNSYQITYKVGKRIITIIRRGNNYIIDSI